MSWTEARAELRRLAAGASGRPLRAGGGWPDWRDDQSQWLINMVSKKPEGTGEGSRLWSDQRGGIKLDGDVVSEHVKPFMHTEGAITAKSQLRDGVRGAKDEMAAYVFASEMYDRNEETMDAVFAHAMRTLCRKIQTMPLKERLEWHHGQYVRSWWKKLDRTVQMTVQSRPITPPASMHVDVTYQPAEFPYYLQTAPPVQQTAAVEFLPRVRLEKQGASNAAEGEWEELPLLWRKQFQIKLSGLDRAQRDVVWLEIGESYNGGLRVAIPFQTGAKIVTRILEAHSLVTPQAPTVEHDTIEKWLEHYRTHWKHYFDSWWSNVGYELSGTVRRRRDKRHMQRVKRIQRYVLRSRDPRAFFLSDYDKWVTTVVNTLSSQEDLPPEVTKIVNRGWLPIPFRKKWWAVDGCQFMWKSEAERVEDGATEKDGTVRTFMNNTHGNVRMQGTEFSLVDVTQSLRLEPPAALPFARIQHLIYTDAGSNEPLYGNVLDVDWRPEEHGPVDLDLLTYVCGVLFGAVPNVDCLCIRGRKGLDRVSGWILGNEVPAVRYDPSPTEVSAGMTFVKGWAEGEEGFDKQSWLRSLQSLEAGQATHGRKKVLFVAAAWDEGQPGVSVQDGDPVWLWQLKETR